MNKTSNRSVLFIAQVRFAVRHQKHSCYEYINYFINWYVYTCGAYMVHFLWKPKQINTFNLFVYWFCTIFREMRFKKKKRKNMFIECVFRHFKQDQYRDYIIITMFVFAALCIFINKHFCEINDFLWLFIALWPTN